MTPPSSVTAASHGSRGVGLVSLLPKVAARARGALVRAAVRLAGGTCGPRLRVEKGLRVRHGWHAGFDIGTDVYLGRYTTFDCPTTGALRIGSRCSLTQGAFISAGARVEIGDDCLIGEYTSLRDTSHGTAANGVPMREQLVEPRPILMGNDIWLGRGVVVVGGVEVGSGAVVGANSVVTRDVPPMGIAVGAPARVTRYREP